MAWRGISRRPAAREAHTRGVLLWVALLASLAAGPARADELAWRLFRPDGAGFEVELPGPPEHRQNDERSLLGRVKHEYYWVERAGAKLDIERHELPRLATRILSNDRLLDRIQADLMQDLGTEPTLEQRVELQGFPGRRVLYARGDPVPLPEETRLYLVGNTLFVVATGAYPPETRQPIVDRFFASFRLIVSDVEE